ncbi:hypothetical protein [Pseudomonas graminis]
MKELSTEQVEQVSGALNLGSLMGFLGMKPLADNIHKLEADFYDATFGKIPKLGPAMKNFFTDAFNQYPAP